MNSVTIGFHAPINGAYTKFYSDVPDNEIASLVESCRHLNRDGSLHKTPEGLKPFDNIRSVRVVNYAKFK